MSILKTATSKDYITYFGLHHSVVSFFLKEVDFISTHILQRRENLQDRVVDCTIESPFINNYFLIKKDEEKETQLEIIKAKIILLRDKGFKEYFAYKIIVDFFEQNFISNNERSQISVEKSVLISLLMLKFVLLCLQEHLLKKLESESITHGAKRNKNDSLFFLNLGNPLKILKGFASFQKEAKDFLLSQFESDRKEILGFFNAFFCQDKESDEDVLSEKLYNFFVFDVLSEANELKQFGEKRERCDLLIQFASLVKSKSVKRFIAIYPTLAFDDVFYKPDFEEEKFESSALIFSYSDFFKDDFLRIGVLLNDLKKSETQEEAASYLKQVSLMLKKFIDEKTYSNTKFGYFLLSLKSVVDVFLLFLTDLYGSKAVKEIRIGKQEFFTLIDGSYRYLEEKKTLLQQQENSSKSMSYTGAVVVIPSLFKERVEFEWAKSFDNLGFYNLLKKQSQIFYRIFCYFEEEFAKSNSHSIKNKKSDFLLEFFDDNITERLDKVNFLFEQS